VAVTEEGFDQMRTDKTSTARDEMNFIHDDCPVFCNARPALDVTSD
jgi:hypothetical protein